MMNIPMNQFQLTPQQIDICFYNSVKQLQNSNKCFKIFYASRFGLVLWHIVTHFQMIYPDDNSNASTYDMITILYFIMLASNIGTFLYSTWSFQKYLGNPIVLNDIAQRIQHSQNIYEDNSQDQQSFYRPDDIQKLSVSKRIYQFSTNLELRDVDQEYKIRAQRNCKALITQNIEINAWFRFWHQLFNLISLGIFVFSIVILSRGDAIEATDYFFIISYLTTEVLIRFFLYLILLLIALSPICCLGVCIYSCFFSQKKDVVLPQKQQATLDIVRDCEGQCPICYQNIKEKQQVIILKCSPKHVFHELCIKGWTKIGNTCPICRVPI